MAILFVCVRVEAVDMFDEKVREDGEEKEVEEEHRLSIAATNQWTTEKW